MRLSDWLETEGVKQIDFAKDLGVTQSRVSQIVRNGTDSLSVALRIQKLTAGKVKVADLLREAA